MSENLAAEVPAETNIETDISLEASPEAPESTEEAPAPEGEAGQEELKEELQEQIKQLKLKIDGEEVEEELPFEVSPEQAEWLQKELQLARVAQKRMQETAELTKKDMQTQEDMKNFFSALKENPIKVLEDIGIDTKDMSEKRLQEEIKKMEMTEEEREIEDLRQKLKDHEEKQEAAKQQAALEKQERLRDQYAAEYEKDLMDAIEKSALPSNPEIVQRLAQYMQTAIKLGIDISFNELMPLVQESMETDLVPLVRSLPIEKIIEILGNEQVSNIISKKNPKATKKAPVTPKDIEDTATKKDKEDPFAKKYKKGSMKDFFNKI